MNANDPMYAGAVVIGSAQGSFYSLGSRVCVSIYAGQKGMWMDWSLHVVHCLLLGMHHLTFQSSDTNTRTLYIGGFPISIWSNCWINKLYTYDIEGISIDLNIALLTL